MIELLVLVPFLGLALLVAVLMGLRSSNRSIEALKLRMDSLEGELSRLHQRLSNAPPSEKKPEVRQPEALQSVEPLVAEKPPEKAAPPPIPAAAKSVAPPPLRQAASVAAPPPIPQKETEPVKTFELFAFLRSIGLWPPERQEGSSELVLMQWWAPRIGGGLAILAIIFFAVYVAQGTPPWVKFAEMLAASFSVFGLGLFFSKKRPGLGNVLVATGLAMVYISSVAGYAVGPVKVVDNPILGALMQVASLVLSFGMGAWRKDRGILVLAIIFGYVSSLFAALEGFREAALISSLLIYLAGLFSYR
ncbi:MAG: hypothetical protein KJT03_24400, partial [Verrucomicrobiae bacterium]|nr:hypothetical protein [Verrucomicrobiae bacterium]